MAGNYRQKVPPAQPRSLRSVAETKGTVPQGFDGAMPYVPTTGMSAEAPGATQTYNDEAASTGLTPSPRPTNLDPKPFGTLKRGG